jgi:hypothetical protein
MNRQKNDIKADCITEAYRSILGFARNPDSCRDRPLANTKKPIPILRELLFTNAKSNNSYFVSFINNIL